MSSALALLMAVSGGLFGTLTALTIFFFIVKAFVTHAIKVWVKGPQDRKECPICKRPMQYDRPPDGSN